MMIRTATAAGAVLALLAIPATAQAQAGKHAAAVPPPMVSVPTVQAMPAASTLPATPAKLALGREIAELLNGGEVSRIQYDKLFTETMPKSLGDNPVFRQLEGQYPGLIAYIIAAVRPMIEKAMNDRAPLLYDRMATIYATNLTEPELHEMLDFYRSPAGIWLVHQVASGMDMSALFNRAMADPNTRIVPGDFTSAQQGALATSLPTMPAEHRAALMQLGTRPVMLKLLQVNPLLTAAAAAWGNETPVELQQQVGQAMAEAAKRYVGEHPAK